MIHLVHGDILQADAEALVNTVNCVGIMGRGIALQFRKAFPDNYKAYQTVCRRKQLHPGIMLVFDLNRLENPRFIINFPTKNHWRSRSRIEDIESGLRALLNEIHERNIRSVAIPPLGCGLGGLDWSDVRPHIEKAFESLPDVKVLLYEPAGAPPAAEMRRPRRRPSMTIGRAALLGLMRRYLAAAMDPDVTLLEIHKLMYFMQEAGEPLKLQYAKARYGPYAENLRHVMNHIEGHFITGYDDAEDNPQRRIELLDDASSEAERFLQSRPETQRRFDRVADLIAGFETPYGMELLATVHWVATRENANTPMDATAKTYAWNDRKSMFPEDHIGLAWQVLVDKRWMSRD